MLPNTCHVLGSALKTNMLILAVRQATRDSCPEVSRLHPKLVALLLKINSVRGMITNKLKKGVDTNLETSWILNIRVTMGNVKMLTL
jgi:hypothetical protein